MQPWELVTTISVWGGAFALFLYYRSRALHGEKHAAGNAGRTEATKPRIQIARRARRINKAAGSR